MAEVKLISLPYEASLAVLFPLVSDLPYPILLDSNHAHFQDTRFDLFSAAPRAVISAQDDNHQLEWLTEPCLDLQPSSNPLDTISQIVDQMAAQPWANDTSIGFNGGLLGYYGYEAGRYVEQLPRTVEEDVGMPTILLGLYGWAVISDHQSKTTSLIITPWCHLSEDELVKRLQQTPVNPSPTFSLLEPFKANMSAKDYKQRFDQIQAYIQAGDCYQVNLAQRFSSPYQGNPWQAYLALKSTCPTPFSAYIQLPDGRAVLSHSPERFIQSHDGRVESKPIKGTRPRGATIEQDRALAEELLNSEKDRAENLMIVDLLRNDLGRNCITGSVKVPKLFHLETYANVHHMVSTVVGEVDHPSHAINVFQESFPGGSITGAPKVRSMEIIDELEPHERSVYCGSIMYFSCNGQMDSSITIRTLVADGQSIHCWAGGALVADSDCESEYQETFTKVGNLTHTLEMEFLR